MQARHMRIGNYPLMKENEEKGDYNVRLWREFGGTNVSLCSTRPGKVRRASCSRCPSSGRPFRLA